MRVLAIDYGSRAIGVAVCDELRLTVRPLTTLRLQEQDRAQIIARIVGLVEEYKAGELIVGMPFNMDGTKGAAARQVEQFIDELRSVVTIPIVAQDERLTSYEADARLRESGASRRERKAKSDEYAATIILQDYLATTATASPQDFPDDE
ncbi:MAG: Holliday junction resolvase RuvX [Deltaproteobacteria bacterium]|nr:Holliday junction resolvase RuvX [Deltaproteobacteria bacterium]